MDPFSKPYLAQNEWIRGTRAYFAKDNAELAVNEMLLINGKYYAFGPAGEHRTDAAFPLAAEAARLNKILHPVPEDTRSGADLDYPFTVDGVIVVNKQHHVSARYVPVVTNDYRPVTPEVKVALNDLLAAAKASGHYLSLNSGYRSYALQQQMFAREAAIYGDAAANRLTARAGESEHQTGLAVDLTDNNNSWANFTSSFGTLPSGRWLANNAHKYGFILRYIKGKEHVTGYSYEPWHFRYVGKTIAAEIGPNPSITLEEYLGLYP